MIRVWCIIFCQPSLMWLLIHLLTLVPFISRPICHIHHRIVASSIKHSQDLLLELSGMMNHLYAAFSFYLFSLISVFSFFREDDFNDPIHLERISTMNTFSAQDLGGFPLDRESEDYTKTYKTMNDWFVSYISWMIRPRHILSITFSKSRIRSIFSRENIVFFQLLKKHF